MNATHPTTELPLFPLQAVLFPGGLMPLKVFEPRYLDLVSNCLRERQAFGVVALLHGRETRSLHETPPFEPIGTQAELMDVDSEHPGILQVRCQGAQRFQVLSSAQQEDGLWVAQTTPLAMDAALAPDTALIKTVRALASAIAALKAKNSAPFLEPFRFDDAGWVANRWCEILPISQAAKQRLMELPDPMLRLRLVDDYLRGKGVVK